MNNQTRISMFSVCLVTFISLTAMAAYCDAAPGKSVRIEPPKPTPALPPSKQILAKVNGKPIYMAPLYDALVADYGLPIAQQLIVDEVVRQELARLGLDDTVTQQQMAEENARTLDAIFNFASGAKKPSPQQMDTLLGQFLAKRNNTRRQWAATIARNVRLGRIAAGQVKVTEEDIQQEFYRRYDGKLKVRHIQVPTLDVAQKVLRELGRGGDFSAIAYKYSTSPSAKTGAWLGKIGTRDAPPGIGPALLAAARAMRKPGEVSDPVQVGTNFHILKLETIIPPTDAKYSEVADELGQAVRYRKIARARQLVLQELINKAKPNIEYVNPIIRSKKEQR
ncbi:MAG: hypothetical protein DRP83_04170 [Planctomycetota bacterium]|nr:MAG: hypothetical protein DRP83_04170 [Planctomycetota bacterium]